jgi:hypothetical protein
MFGGWLIALLSWLVTAAPATIRQIVIALRITSAIGFAHPATRQSQGVSGCSMPARRKAGDANGCLCRIKKEKIS